MTGKTHIERHHQATKCKRKKTPGHSPSVDFEGPRQNLADNVFNKFNHLTNARPLFSKKQLINYGALPNMYYIARKHIARKTGRDDQMARFEQKVPQGFSSWEVTLPNRIANRMRVREWSVKSLTVRLAKEGHQVSRHRLGRIVGGKTPLTLGDAIGLGRVLFDDPRALFRTTGKEQ